MLRAARRPLVIGMGGGGDVVGALATAEHCARYDGCRAGRRRPQLGAAADRSGARPPHRGRDRGRAAPGSGGAAGRAAHPRAGASRSSSASRSMAAFTGPADGAGHSRRRRAGDRRPASPTALARPGLRPRWCSSTSAATCSRRAMSRGCAAPCVTPILLAAGRAAGRGRGAGPARRVRDRAATPSSPPTRCFDRAGGRGRGGRSGRGARADGAGRRSARGGDGARAPPRPAPRRCAPSGGRAAPVTIRGGARTLRVDHGRGLRPSSWIRGSPMRAAGTPGPGGDRLSRASTRPTRRSTPSASGPSSTSSAEAARGRPTPVIRPAAAS